MLLTGSSVLIAKKLTDFHNSRAAKSKFHSPPPRALRDWYQSVPRDVNFDILDVPKKITLAKFGFLSIFVQPRDEKRAFLGWGVGTLNSTQKPYMKTNRIHMRYQLKADILLFLVAYWLKESIH